MAITSKHTSDIIYCVIIYLICTLLFLSATGCANMPTRYHQAVRITSGVHRGEIGRLIGDCSGFENYKVRLMRGTDTCVRAWNMEAL